MGTSDPIRAKRDAAARARRIALSLSSEDDVARILAFAQELEAQADAMEAALAAEPPPVTRTEMQMQQQQADTEKKDGDPK